MKTKTLIILGGVLVAAVVAVIVKMSGGSPYTPPPVEVGQTLLKSVPVENVGAFVVNDGKNTVEVKNKDGKWVIVNRDDFPASVSSVNEVTDSAFNLKVQHVEKGVGKSQYSRLGLAEAGGTAKGEEVGKTLAFKDSSGKDMAALVVGKTQEAKFNPNQMDFSGPQPHPQSIQVKGDDVIYQTATGFSKLDADPKGWLDKEKFVKVDKLKSITVTGPTPEESWKLTREKEGGELKLADVKPGEEFDATKAAGPGAAFSSAVFEDVLAAAEKDKAALDKPTHTAVLETFDGLTYTIKVGAKVPPPPAEPNVDPKSPPPTPPDAYYVSYTVEGKLDETIPPYGTPAPVAPTGAAPAAPPADAKDEDKKKYEEEKKKFDDAQKSYEAQKKTWDEGKKSHEDSFKNQLVTKKDKLATEQAMQSRIFVYQKYTLESIMKKRADLMKDKAVIPPGGENPAAGTPTPGANPTASTAPVVTPVTPRPTGKIEAVTPPIEVKLPGTEKPKAPPEIKPKESPPAEAPKKKQPEKKKPK